MNTLFTWLLFAVWAYVGSCFLADSFYNLYVNRLRTALFRPVTGIQRMLPRCPEVPAAELLFLLVLLARCALGAFFAHGPVVTLGTAALAAPYASLPRSAALTLGAFGTLLAQLTLLREALVWRLGRGARSAPLEFLGTATWPVPRLRTPPLRLAASAGLFLVSAMLCAIGGGLAESGFHPRLMATLRLAQGGLIDTLLLLQNLIMVLCLLSFFGILSLRPGRWASLFQFLGGLANDWLHTIARATVGREMVAGALNFTPIIIWFVLRLLHPLLLATIP